MHKLESFALSSCSKIEKPYIHKQFYPIVQSKFICVSQDSLDQSKTYDYYDDVLFHIHPYLAENGISIIEIGDTKNKKLFHTTQLKGLNINQYSYILSKCDFYLGNLNLFASICGHYGKNIFCPSNNDYEESSSPYWKTKESHIIYPKSKLKPLFIHSENPKTINKVNPENIAIKILDSLKIDHSLGKVKTIYSGENYCLESLDILPDDSLMPSVKFESSVNIRMDKEYNLNFLKSCNKLNKISITTNQVIPPEYLFFLKENIEKINLILSTSTTQREIEILESIGKPVQFFYKDKKSINDIRVKFIDKSIFEYPSFSKRDLNVKNLNNLKFLSKKNIFYKNKLYNSYLSISLGRNTSDVKDSLEFWEDLSFYRIYKQSS